MALSRNDRLKLVMKGFIVIRVEERSRTIKVGGGLFNDPESLKDVTTYVIKRSTCDQFIWHDYNVLDTKAKLKKQIDELLNRPDTILDE